MNKEEITGNVTQLTGKIKEQAGKLMDDESLEAEGQVQVLGGKWVEYYGQKKSMAMKKLNQMIAKISSLKIVQPPKAIEVKV